MQDNEEEKYVIGMGNVPSGEIAFPFPAWGNLHYSCLGQFCIRTVGSKKKKVELFLHFKILVRKISRLQRTLWKYGFQCCLPQVLAWVAMSLGILFHLMFGKF